MVPSDGFKSQTTKFRECNSTVECLTDTEKVVGSTPIIPTGLKKMVLDLRGKRNLLFPGREKF